MIGSRVSGEFANHSIASLAEGNDERLSGVGMMDGCSRWGMDEGTKEGNDAFDFFLLFPEEEVGAETLGLAERGRQAFRALEVELGFSGGVFQGDDSTKSLAIN